MFLFYKKKTKAFYCISNGEPYPLDRKNYHQYHCGSCVMMILIYVTHFQVERCFPTIRGSPWVWELGGGSVKFPLQQPSPAHALSHGTWSCTWPVLSKGGKLMNIGSFCWQRVGSGIVQSYIFGPSTSLAERVWVWGLFLITLPCIVKAKVLWFSKGLFVWYKFQAVCFFSCHSCRMCGRWKHESLDSHFWYIIQGKFSEVEKELRKDLSSQSLPQLILTHPSTQTLLDCVYLSHMREFDPASMRARLDFDT